MDLNDAVIRVQLAYPRVYLACHTEHQNSRTTPHRLSQRDATILAHLSPSGAVRQSDLGRHLGIAKSTLSEALRWLIECGYVARDPNDEIRLTSHGIQAMSSSSVLQRDRLEAVLARLAEPDRCRAVEGLELLARAALESKTEENPK
ncbi:MAG: MarR family winged helix-turn-helix transcriptional regulator [Bryobacteraceae bacterium]|nr:MarR family winged helix-turn-helix transcriptional regulator [Bryobacteraceae bacterium]